MISRIALLAALALAPVGAAAQSIQQSGTVTPGHAARWISNGVIGDAGTAQNGSLTTLGILNNGGPGICINSAAVTAPYQQLCLSAATAGVGKITLTNYGGAAAQKLQLISNGGAIFQLPPTTGANGQFLTTDGTGATSWGSPAGSGTVNVGTAGQMAYYATSTAAVAGNSNANISNGTLTLGTTNTTLGALVLDGSTSGAVTVRPAAAAGTWTFTLPTSGGSSGQVLQTDGAGTATWATPSVTGVTSISAGTGITLTPNPIVATGTVAITATITAGGPTGSATVTPVVTYNAQGQLTAVSSATIAPPFSAVTGQATLAQLPTMAANTALANVTGGGATPTPAALPSCSTSASALIYTSGTGFGCNTISGSGTVNIGGAGQLAYYPAATNVVGGNSNANISNGALTLGVATSTIGQLLLAGNTSGTVTLTPQAAAGTPTITFGTSSGTPAVTASAPLGITTATGNATCATCATTTNGGALSGTAPVAISAAGAISITGAAGQVLGGVGPAFTATPTLGAAAGTTGALNLVGTTSGTVTFSVADAAGTWTLKLPTSAGSAGQFLSTDGSGNATWATAAGSGTVNSGTSGQMAYYASTTNAVSGNTNANISAGALTLGQSGTIGQLKLAGNTSGTVTIAPQAVAGTPTITWGTTSGTPAVSATSPVTINTTTGVIAAAFLAAAAMRSSYGGI